MQFFHLFSFVVVASYAAALPQPARLSEKYSSNVDTNLASGLGARSYQPGLNSKKESATLMSLKRRDDSEGSSGENSGSDPSPPPDTTSNDSEGSSEENSGTDPSPPPVTTPDEPFIDPFTEDKISSENLASTINNVGDGVVNLFKDGELLIQRIADSVRDRVARYLRRHAYANVALRRWSDEVAPNIVEFIKSGLDEDEYTRIEPKLTKTTNELKDDLLKGLNAVHDATTKILSNDGSVIENMQKIEESFHSATSSRVSLLWALRARLGIFIAGKTLQVQLDNVIQSVGEFLEEQQKLHGEIMENLKAEPSQE
ncbi:hypothetical protein BASA50_001736 [Batrachochytrium salamandrivorans]|uniref:Secreted protein n=1 Tax=Batrachochytrium salamandrivorans TaxID=1357716 RepID=A0ABQ8FNA7_9FUNG|nr:hypothetical protein BASA62_007490 [Batrachochytrium salamandrivorans]KAH6582717.1 hypothetical protein BASA60_001778 [Batrachochytrium salamandrivorans]KAH6601211.1 hypothetical protein BASA50_001736 [Batrachochytrium salamandrivorans]KAH9250986.1 hypothetical protein BASA81_011160 [Batrachochytrium salamandrivorans]KAH9268630.1 hypothetical protein BASA83_009262 [Batrachochytrium salamandrivorans]